MPKNSSKKLNGRKFITGLIDEVRRKEKRGRKIERNPTSNFEKR